MPLVACAGSQGCGKTTILNSLRSLGYPVIQRKTSRSILEDWNVSLSEVNNNRDLTIKFQDEILRRKVMDEKEALMSDEIVFTERTFCDLFTYALVALGKDNEYDEWLNNYYNHCMRAQQMYDMVFYITAGHFNIQRDNVRASNKYYSTMVDLTMMNFTRQMTPTSRLNIIDTPHLQDRVNVINSITQSTLNRTKSNLELLTLV